MEQTAEKVARELGFIFAYVDTEERWTVDGDGELVDHIEDTDYMSDPTAYGCTECDEQFSNFEDALKHAKKHL